MKNLLIKYKQFIAYAVFGALTTVVNMAVYWLLAHPLHLDTMASTIIAWFAAVAFAYITNRKWVFDSKATGAKEITREVVSFFLCRLATGVLDWAWMLLFVNILHFNDVLMKAVANIIVILANYIFSKLVIFKKKER